MAETNVGEREIERQAIIDWLRRDVGGEATQMVLAAGMPGGTRTQRVKNAAYAQGVCHAVASITQALCRGDHLPTPPTQSPTEDGCDGE